MCEVLENKRYHNIFPANDLPSTRAEDLCLLSIWSDKVTSTFTYQSLISLESIERGFLFLNEIEQELGISSSTFTHFIQGGLHYLLVTGDAFWKRDTVRVSFWVDFIRSAHNADYKITNWTTALQASRYRGSRFGTYYTGKGVEVPGVLEFSKIYKFFPWILNNLKFVGMNGDQNNRASYMGYVGALYHLRDPNQPGFMPVSKYGTEFAKQLLRFCKQYGVETYGYVAK